MENQRVDKNTILKGLKFVIIVSLFISAIIILFTIDKNSFTKIIKNLSLKYIVYILILMFFNWLFAGLRLKILVNAIGGDVSLKDSMIIFLSGAFVSNVTPFASGGGPFQVYFLHKKGVNVGKSSVVIVVQFVLRLFIFGILTPIFLIFFNNAISPGVVPGYIFYLAFGVGLLISLSIILFTLVPKISNKFIKSILSINKLKEFIKNSQKAKRWLVKARKELKEFRYSLMVLSKNKKELVLGGLFTVLFWACLFTVIPVLLMGMGAEPHFFKAYVMQTILYLVLPYMPTPGASGIAEVGCASIFVAFIPSNLIGLVVFGWRLFTFHLVLIIGGFFALREIGKNRSNEND